MKELKLGEYYIKIEATDIDGNDITIKYLEHLNSELDLLHFLLDMNNSIGAKNRVRSEVIGLEAFLRLSENKQK